MKRLVTVICLTVMTGALGCTDAVHEAEPTDETGSAVAAGSASLELGVAYWDVKASGVARGYSVDNELIAEFRVDGQTRVVESVLPDRGVRALDGSHGALSSRALAYWEALVIDVEAQIEGIEQPEVPAGVDGDTVDKAIYGCYQWWNDCDVTGFYGILQGWWTGYICEISNNTRPYCGNWWALLY